MQKPAILLHENELNNTGVDIKPMMQLKKKAQMPHRDDHYMFIIQQDGFFSFELDFKKINLKGPTLSFVAPGQVHNYLHLDKCKGWWVFADAGVIPGQYREIFNNYLNLQQSIRVQKNDPAFQIAPLLLQMPEQKQLSFQKPLIVSLMETLAGLVASKLVQSQHSETLIGGQKYHTVTRFKQLLSANIKETKQVKAYASLLHITPLYLNEIVKEITGFSPSYWINQEILLEIKRMLCYSSLDIRQIAYESGYEDDAYFSRFFKKHTGMTPLAFRKQNHYLYNHSH